ncbi:MAG: hypothetical protein O3A95_06190 [Planctomycetota bacterium]|nr:hypothetical protein [Planctomycetota bacterium]MDA1113872.1 hypothetical protein [Planctomycetota bacterium]
MLIPLLLITSLATNPGRTQEPSALQQLEAWAADAIVEDQQDIVYAQLRGRCFAPEAEALVAMLSNAEIPRRSALLELLLQVPYPEARLFLIAFAKDEARPATERGRVAEFLFLLDGHEAYSALKDTIRPDAEPPYLRRVYAGWRESVEASDLPVLEQLATEASGYASEYALQLWALHETQQEARVRIYMHARDRAPSFRAAAWKALSTRGLDPEIADLLRVELDGGKADVRNLARAMLLVFSGPEEFLEEYKGRAGNLSIHLRSPWMVPLASLSIPEAHHLAMDWLLEGGWNAGNVTRQVVLQLSRSEEIDPMLPVLFQHPEMPDQVLFPLALARSGTSEDAKAYLLTRLNEGGVVMQMQIARAFAGQNSTAGLEVLRDIAESTVFSNPARSLARELLVPREEAAALVERWLQDPLPRDYEIAASWIRALAESSNPSWREQAIALASAAQGFEEQDEQNGLRLEAWSALARLGEPQLLPLFEQRLQVLLMQTQSSSIEGEAWDSLYRLGRDYPELNAILDGLRRSAQSGAQDSMVLNEDFQLKDIPSDLLLIASASLADSHPKTSAAWFTHLLARDLPAVDQLRIQGLIAHRLPIKDLRSKAFQTLLSDPEGLEANRRVIMEAFSPQATSWILLDDRLKDWAHLEAIEDGDLEVTSLDSFTHGYVEDWILARAVDIAAQAELPELGLALAQRRVDHSALSGQAHAALAALQEAAGMEKEARQSWGRVLRLSPDRGDLWTQAKAALGGETP